MSWNLDATDIRDTAIPPDWKNIRVGHIDTGIRPNPILGSVLFEHGLNLLEPGEPATPPPGTSPPNCEDPSDILRDMAVLAHGTRTSSILCGLDPDGGFRGAAPGVPVVPVRAMNGVVLLTAEERDRVATGIRHAMSTNCQVISISLGVPGISLFGYGMKAGEDMARAVDEAYEAGVIICGAGGQYLASCCYPGKFFRTIGVGGYEEGLPGAWPVYADGKYTTGADFIDVWAPARQVLRLNGDAPDDSDYQKGAGTSYATPHVAAAAALWLRWGWDDIDAKYGATWRRVEAFRLLLKKTAFPLNGFGFGPNFPDVNVRRPDAGETPPSKGMSIGMSGISGGLNVQGILDAPLPDIGDGRKERSVMEQDS